MHRSDNREEFLTVVWGVARVGEVTVQKDMIPVQGVWYRLCRYLGFTEVSKKL